MPLVPAIDLISKDCFANAATYFTATSIQADYTLTGASSGAIGLQTFSATLSGGGSAPGWTRSTSNGFIQRSFNPSAFTDFFIAKAKCCSRRRCAQVILGSPPGGGFTPFKIPDAIDVECSCTGTPCTGYPISQTFDLFILVFVELQNPCDQDNPQYKIKTDFSISNDAEDQPCGGFNSIDFGEGDTGVIDLADVIGTHNISIMTGSGATTITCDAVITIS